MKKFIISSILFTVVLVNISAQDDGFYAPDKPDDPKSAKKELRQKKLERWSFGGNFWLSFGNDAYVEVSPLVAYHATPRLKLGAGFTYIYYKYSYINYESSVYGPRLMLNYTVFSGLQDKININIGDIVLHSEYEFLNTDEVDPFGYLTDDRIWVQNFLLGGGIYQPFSNRGGISLLILWNIFDYNNSAYNYSNPIFRLGFYF